MENGAVTQFSDNPAGITGILRRSSVGIAGCGGIGSNLAVNLVRAGVGRLVLVDHDRVELRNLNRQSYFLDHVGCPKVEALSTVLQLINPEVTLDVRFSRLEAGLASVPFRDCDALVEAVDARETKVMLLENWMRDLPGKMIFACSGIAGYGGTDLLKVDRRQGLTIVGDQFSELSRGTLSSRVAIVAAMMANEIIEHLLQKSA